MKDRKMANLPPSKSKLVLLIVQQTNSWREDEYADIRCVNISVMQVNYSNRVNTGTPMQQNRRETQTAARLQKNIFWNFQTHQQLFRWCIFNIRRMNISRDLHYENDALDGIEQ